MSSDVSLHVLYKIANATIQPYPFPHILVRDVFPQDYYWQLRDRLPPREAMMSLRSLERVGAGYPDTRLVLPLAPKFLDAVAEPFRSFWREVAGWMLDGGLARVMLAKFGEFLQRRLGEMSRLRFHHEALLVQDYTTYSLGPHTDSPQKVLSFLFYLPADESRSHLGTSIYIPNDPAFTCAGGPHHPFKMFRRMCTMPYVPNAMFAFVKTRNSFHGVEPVTEVEARRDLLLYDIKVQNPPELAQAAPAAGAAPAQFSF